MNKTAMNRLDLLAALSACLKACALASEHREALKTVHIRHEKDRIDIVATNGHWLALWREPTKAVEGLSQMNVRIESVKLAIKWLKDIATDNVVSIDFDGALLTKNAMYSLSLLHQDFPPYHRTLPTLFDGEGPQYIGLDSYYLKKIHEAFKAACGLTSLVFEFSSQELGPVAVTCPGSSRFRAILMPMRAERPQWDERVEASPNLRVVGD
jgi:DNA polymerase III sliding clamp (beta) subunit (PCNA family)